MMRPMKLAGNQLIFGEGCLEHLKTLPYKKAIVVTGGTSMAKSRMLSTVEAYLHEGGMQTTLFEGVEPDPSFETVLKGAQVMQQWKPDLIVALGGGSSMDAAKMMWVYYEHPEFTTLQEVLEQDPFPRLRQRAHFCCIPSTAGTASEVSRSVVITDKGQKHGIGNMEMMPDISICDPEVTKSMPPRITAETGMDAMTHALEALVSRRANYISDILCKQAIKDIAENLPKAYEDGQDVQAREMMLNASMAAGMAFTNVSLGIVHSMAHSLGSLFHVAHGLADAILLPYVIRFNSENSPEAKEVYDNMAKTLGGSSMEGIVAGLNKKIGIPATLNTIIEAEKFEMQLDALADMSMVDGCTKTNPVIPTRTQFITLLQTAFAGQ